MTKTDDIPLKSPIEPPPIKDKNLDAVSSDSESKTSNEILKDKDKDLLILRETQEPEQTQMRSQTLKKSRLGASVPEFVD